MSQLNDLNSNIPAKNRRIKKCYPTMNRVRVFFRVQVNHGGECVALSKELTASQAKRLFDSLDLSLGSDAQLVRIQTSGYVGGIILGGSRDVLEKKGA